MLKVFGLFVAMLPAAWAQIEIPLPAGFEAHQEIKFYADYVTLDLPVAPAEAVLESLKELGHGLKGRGEAHITLITPIEWAKCFAPQKVGMGAVQRELGDAEVAFQVEGLGSGRKGQMENFFIIVTSPDMLALRKKVWALLPKGCPAAPADRYYPHITVGFTDRDLHESDGVLKDVEHSLDERYVLTVSRP